MLRLITALFGISLVALTSCTPSHLPEDELRAWVADPAHGLLQEQVRKGIAIRMGYRPTDLLVAQELKAHPQATAEEAASWRQHYSQFQYFILSFSVQGSEALYTTMSDQGQFSQVLQNLSFRLPEYAQALDENGEEIAIADFQYSRTFGHGTSTSVLVALAPAEDQDMSEINWNLTDPGLGFGAAHFSFSGRTLRKAPKLAWPTKN